MSQICRPSIMECAVLTERAVLLQPSASLANGLALVELPIVWSSRYLLGVSREVVGTDRLGVTAATHRSYFDKAIVSLSLGTFDSVVD
jgi:hypothetical protein